MRIWSPPPMDTQIPEKVTSSLRTDWEGIDYLREWEWTTKTRTYWTKRNSRSCYFMCAFCESVLLLRSSRPISVLQPSWPQYGSTTRTTCRHLWAVVITCCLMS
ncbi:hypothetical protein EVAR_52980_1 [Eumeta japonica]|uniref:Uncharacterized protein n=1 Tax=Eumeta variegata TaxID=151549 RepID=A0A4C1Z8A6_EUMVA|nr:hypothetical protein EVAR_52980_1 [Eumeta japonica]